MDIKILGLIELAVFFGGILAFCLYQLRAVRRSREPGSESQADTAKAGRKDAGDVFWDTMTRPRKKD